MYKSKLQELCHQYAWQLPEYETTKDGSDHNPRFSGSANVNGVSFQSPPNQCRSSKEAQNEAARIAFEYLTAPKPILQQSLTPSPPPQSKPPIISSPPLPPPTSTVFYDSKDAKIGLAEQQKSPIVQAVEIPLSFKEDKSSKDMLHMYKSRLQNYAQKRNFTLPTYSCQIMGPPHDRRFKSKVTIDGKSYETSDCYTNLKDAEHAAAKVAFESMSLHETQEDEGLYKTLLQKFTQKGGFHIPTYETDKSGPLHMPTFLTKVEIGGEIFEGQKAKSKKLSEMNAAKAAYNSLIERRARKYPIASSPDSNIMGALEVAPINMQQQIIDKVEPNVLEKVEPEVVLEPSNSKDASEEFQSGQAKSYSTVFYQISHIMGALEIPPFDLQPRIMDKVQPKVVEKVKTEVVLKTKSSNKEEAEDVQSGRGIRHYKNSSPGFQNKAVSEVPSFKLQPNAKEKVEPKIVPEIDNLIGKQASRIKEIDINGETQKNLSSYESEYARLRRPASTFSPPKDANDGPFLSSPTIPKSAAESFGGDQNSANKRVLVCARIPHLEIPEGATILPISDNEWLAMKLEVTHSH